MVVNGTLGPKVGVLYGSEHVEPIRSWPDEVRRASDRSLPERQATPLLHKSELELAIGESFE